MRDFILPLVLIAAVGLLALSGTTGKQDREEAASFSLPDEVDFNYHIRPILSTNCFICHGPDPSSREADLRLDTREGATAWSEDSVRAIVPGDPDASELLRRVAHSDADERMPPPEQKKILSPYEVALLHQWIADGAEWKEHWFLIPPEKPDIPGGLAHWGTENTIDRFVNARLKDSGLKPASLASKATQLRRLSYVLTGLPPTPEAVEAFEADGSRTAYENAVDRILASPHFGERWARHWMDVVRYGDTRGHEFDYPVIGAWQYRDYLIRAFNQDLPYDQFIREQLMGDLVEEPRIDPISQTNQSVLGTAFFTLGEGTHSPVNVQLDEAGRIDNIIDVSTKTFQGLTVACAKCHDHKFDPIPTTDYYALYGVIKSTRFVNRAGNITPNRRLLADSIATLRQHLREMLATDWKTQVPDEPVAAVSAAPSQADVVVLGDFRGDDFDGWQSEGLAFGEAPEKGLLRFGDDGIAAFDGPASSSRGTSKRFAGSLQSPLFTIEEDEVISFWAAGKGSMVRVIMDNFQLIQYPIYGALEVKVDDELGQLYEIPLGKWAGRPAYVEIIPGHSKIHHLVMDEASYIDVAYVLRHAAGTTPTAPARPSPASTVHQALDHWAAGEATDAEIGALNRLLAAGLLERFQEVCARNKSKLLSRW